MTLTRRDVLRRASAVAGSMATAEVGIDKVATQHDHLLELAERDNAERWEYESDRNIGHVQCGFLNREIGVLEEQTTGTVGLNYVDESGHGVPLEFEVSCEGEGAIGTLVHLSAQQAEGLAVDLLEQAHAARRAER